MKLKASANLLELKSMEDRTCKAGHMRVLSTSLLHQYRPAHICRREGSAPP
jgi:hypothetical protein